ncbi:MAG: FtsQ-type POTRA domain-containing protein [Betaproteobacteria bacterium]|nr:FtsQ-type POTRA domain-containing protein [Betaproteobacteria bacterium]
MNVTSMLLLNTLIWASVGVTLWWVLRHPVFAINAITVSGDVRHNNEVTLRANVVPQLQGSFFTVDLVQTKKAFENVPWVRQAMVRRVFPDRLSVDLYEHEPVAYWGNESDSRLVNRQGEVFSANFGELDDENLPHLSGPDAESVRVLRMFNVLSPELNKLGLQIQGLELTGRGSWRAQFKGGASMELGRGNEEDVMTRVYRLSQTLAQVSHRYGRQAHDLESADLRHVNGYALRLRGLGTLDSTATR